MCSGVIASTPNQETASSSEIEGWMAEHAEQGPLKVLLENEPLRRCMEEHVLTGKPGVVIQIESNASIEDLQLVLNELDAHGSCIDQIHGLVKQ